MYPGNSIGNIRDRHTIKYTLPNIAFFDLDIEGETPVDSHGKASLHASWITPWKKKLYSETLKLKKKNRNDRQIYHQLHISAKTLDEMRVEAPEEEKMYFYPSGRSSETLAKDLAPTILNFIHGQSRSPIVTTSNVWIDISEIASTFSLKSDIDGLIALLRKMPELELLASTSQVKYQDALIVCDDHRKGIVAIDFAIDSNSQQPARREFEQLGDHRRHEFFQRMTTVCKVGNIDNSSEAMYLDPSIDTVLVDSKNVTFHRITVGPLNIVGFLHPVNKVFYIVSIFSGRTNRSSIPEIARQHLRRMVKYRRRRKYV